MALTAMTSKKEPLLIANPFHDETISKMEGHFEVYKLWLVPAPEQEKFVEELAPVCRAVATASWTTNPLIYRLPRLEIIACFGVGVDGIDFGITREREIIVTNTPKVLDDAVADLAMGLILATQRNLVSADRFVRKGCWQSGPFQFGNHLSGKTLGIAGLGAIGEEIAKRALPFKLNIAYHNRQKRSLPYTYYPTLNQLAANCDILLSMLPGGPETEKLIDRAVFKSLGKKGTFINLGRGSSVDEDALVTALQSGTIASAGLDVYQNEPEVPAALLEMDNVVLLPHIGSATVETRRAMGTLTLENLIAWKSKVALPSIYA